MKTIIKKIAAVALFGLAVPASAQELASTYFMETGNFNHQLNPALLKEGNIGGLFSNFNIGAGLNVGAKDFFYKNPGDNKDEYPLTTFMNPDISADQFMKTLPKNVRANLGLNMNIFSVAFEAFKGVNLVELNLRSQWGVALPGDLFHFMKTAGSNEEYTFSDLGFRTQNYIELALGHSHKINEQWTVGGKMKLLFGAAYADFSANDFNITMNGDQWSIKGDADLNIAICDMDITKEDEYGNSVPAQAGDDFADLDGFDNLKPGLSGMGVAFDLGATYEPIKGLKVSAALTDLGFISWKNAQKATTSAEWNFDGFDEEIYVTGGGNKENALEKQFERLGEDLEDVFALKYNGKGKHSRALAATLNLGVEYKLPMYDKLKFGFLYSGRMGNVLRNHQGVLTVGVRPVKCFEALLNLSGTTYGWSAGAILSLHAKHFNFHLGAQAPFGKFSKDMYPLTGMNTHLNFGMTFPL